MVRAMMPGVIGIEVLALVVRAGVSPMPDALGVMPRRGGDEAAPAMGMTALMEEGGGGRRAQSAARDRRRDSEQGGLNQLLHGFLSLLKLR